MSRKSKRNRPDTPSAPAAQPASARRFGAGALVAAAIVAVTLAAIAGILLFAGGSSSASAASQAALASTQAPTTGKADARVHIVEFMDPACETCASFFPFVKKMMAANPDKIRLSVRHVAFHPGADAAVRMLEAARAQDRYWEALEAMLAQQDRWVHNHRVQPERIEPVLAAAGLDMERLRRDMANPEVARRMEQDLADAKALQVSKTPEYFVNGRQMPRFGYDELAELVRSELARAYR